MAAKEIALPGEIVKKSNALARARWYAESVWEPRLVALLASKVRTDDTEFQVYEIPVSEVMPERSKGGKDYREIESVVDKVMSRVLTIRDENGRGWTKYNVFSRCRYRPLEGILELGFHPDLKPHYLNLQKYMQYSLMDFMMLPSVYSQRIYEFLKSWDDKPETTISVSDLHEMLNTPESFRADFAQFRRRVLDKAYVDITQKTKLCFEWEPIKQGRAVVSIRFTFGKKRSLPVAKKKTDDAKEKQSQRNNAAAITAMNCLKERGEMCAGGHQKKSICDICLKFRPQESCQK